MDELGLIALLARVGVGAVFLYAGLAKVKRNDVFLRALRSYRVIPGRVHPPLAVIVPAAEVALGLALVAGVAPILSGALAATMLMAFAGVSVASNGWNGNQDCGCFGNPSSGTVRALVVRNLGLALTAVAGSGLAMTLSPEVTAVLSLGVLGLIVAIPALGSLVSNGSADSSRRRFLGFTAASLGAGTFLALTSRLNVAEAACTACGTCTTTYSFIACTGGGCAAYWVRHRAFCPACTVCGSWDIQEFCGIPGC